MVQNDIVQKNELQQELKAIKSTLNEEASNKPSGHWVSAHAAYIQTRSVETKYWLLLCGKTARSNDLNLDCIDRSLTTANTDVACSKICYRILVTLK